MLIIHLVFCLWCYALCGNPIICKAFSFPWTFNKKESFLFVRENELQFIIFINHILIPTQSRLTIDVAILLLWKNTKNECETFNRFPGLSLFHFPKHLCYSFRSCFLPMLTSLVKNDRWTSHGLQENATGEVMRVNQFDLVICRNKQDSQVLSFLHSQLEHWPTFPHHSQKRSLQQSNPQSLLVELVSTYIQGKDCH